MFPFFPGVHGGKIGKEILFSRCRNSSSESRRVREMESGSRPPVPVGLVLVCLTLGWGCGACWQDVPNSSPLVFPQPAEQHVAARLLDGAGARLLRQPGDLADSLRPVQEAAYEARHSDWPGDVCCVRICDSRRGWAEVARVASTCATVGEEQRRASAGGRARWRCADAIGGLSRAGWGSGILRARRVV